jgi:hypothetical protein
MVGVFIGNIKEYPGEISARYLLASICHVDRRVLVDMAFQIVALQKKNGQIHLTQRTQSVSQRAPNPFIPCMAWFCAWMVYGKKPHFHLIFPTKQPQ